MAVIRNSGKISGKMGTFIIRNVGGRIVISARPEKRKVSMLPSQVLARHKFAVAVKLSKNIMKLSTLKDIWRKSTPDGRYIFNFILKSNIRFNEEFIPTTQNIITPRGFTLPVDNAALNAGNLEIDLPALDTAAIFTPAEVNLSVNALVCYTNPVKPKSPPFEIIVLSKEMIDYNFEQAETITIPLSDKQKSAAAKYSNSIIYLAAATKSSKGKVVKYSSTVVRKA